jgi:hypothetical protein
MPTATDRSLSKLLRAHVHVREVLFDNVVYIGEGFGGLYYLKFALR